jgi:hypothetical protein
VNQVITHASHQRPRDFGVLLTQLKGQSLDRFAYHNQLIKHGRLGLEIFEELFPLQACVNAQTARAALAISNRVPSSRFMSHRVGGKDYNSRIQDFLTTYPVLTLFNCPLGYQVHLPPKKNFEFLLHTNMVE